MNTSKTIEICYTLDKELEKYGNINFLTKEELYLLIDYIRYSFNIDIKDVFNVPRFCQDNFKDIVNYDFHKFNDTKIGGLLIKNKFPEQSYITVNASKDSISILFDLTHEMIHFLLHPENRKHYISSSLCDIDNFEWQANEGAAELLVPYKKFIPSFVKNIKNCNSWKEYINLLVYLADKYKVSTSVLEYRISGLKYEIAQYEKGIPIDNIQLLSKTAQEEKGIFITSYNEIFQNKKISLTSILNKIETKKLTPYTVKKSEIVNNSQLQNNIISNINTWEDVLNYFKNSGKIMLYINLLNTEILQINNDTTSIKFLTDISNFSKSVLSKENNIKEIENQINKIYKKQMNILFIDKTNTVINI